VKSKQKFKEPGAAIQEEYEDGDDRNPLNIMYDKRVFRGNTHNMNLLK
jgi:hypothetical protein